MKKTKILVIIMACICIMCVGINVPNVVHAEVNYEMQGAGQGIARMAYISMYSTSLSISDTGVATVSGLVRGKSGTTSTYVKCTLQRDVSGSWKDVKTWEATGNTGATIGETYQLFSHGTYRVYMECSANNETKTATSAYRTY